MALATLPVILRWTGRIRLEKRFEYGGKADGGQILVCVAGCGFYQEEGKTAQELHPGDVVNIPAGAKHWHGASPDSWFSHLAVEVPGTETANEWLEAVSDGEYCKAVGKMG